MKLFYLFLFSLISTKGKHLCFGWSMYYLIYLNHLTLNRTIYCLALFIDNLFIFLLFCYFIFINIFLIIIIFIWIIIIFIFLCLWFRRNWEYLYILRRLFIFQGWLDIWKNIQWHSIWFPVFIRVLINNWVSNFCYLII